MVSSVLKAELEATIPIFYTILSFSYVVSHKVVKTIREKYFFQPDARADDISAPPTTRSFGDLIDAYDGICILCYRLVRTASCAALVFLQLSKPFNLYNSDRDISLAVLYVGIFIIFQSSSLTVKLQLYATALAVRTISATPTRRDFYSRQLFLLLLVDYAVYAHLNLWPLCKVGGNTYDSVDHWTFLPITVFLTVAAIIVPLLIPRPFRPSNSQVRCRVTSYKASEPTRCLRPCRV